MVRLALAQLNLCVGDFSGNLEKMLGALENARAAGADVLVFPELAVCGYPPEDLLYRRAFLQAAKKCLKSLARAAGPTLVFAGFPDYDKNGVYNALAVLQAGKVLAVYRKILLPNYSVFDEKRYFTPGDSALLVECGDLRIGATVCEDVWGARGPVNALLHAGANVIVNASASPYYRGKVREREKMLGGLARGAGAAVAYCNCAGGQDELVFDGGSFILSGKGKTVARAPQFRKTLLIADAAHASGPGAGTGVPAVSVRTVRARRPGLPKPAVAPQVSPYLRPLEEVYHAVVLGLGDYARKNGFTQAVLGLSGGVDSAVTAALACEALGPENVLGVSLPSVFSSRETRHDARRLAENLGMAFREIYIQPLVDQFGQALQEDFAGTAADETEENLQARTRAVLLMAYSNKFRRLLLNTGNKSESSVGYCTLYGDMAGGFAPIKDIPKTLVFKLARFINQREGRAVIPESIIARPPSAELKYGQKDSDSLPEYGVLDRVLYYHIEKHLDPRAIARRGLDLRTAADVARKVRQSEYKRRQAPPGIKITPLALGKDRRMPISGFF